MVVGVDEVVAVAVAVVEEVVGGLVVVGAVDRSPVDVAAVVDELADRVELLADDVVALCPPQAAITSPAVASSAAAALVRADPGRAIERRTLEHRPEAAPTR